MSAILKVDLNYKKVLNPIFLDIYILLNLANIQIKKNSNLIPMKLDKLISNKNKNKRIRVSQLVKILQPFFLISEDQ